MALKISAQICNDELLNWQQWLPEHQEMMLSIQSTCFGAKICFYKLKLTIPEEKVFSCS